MRRWPLILTLLLPAVAACTAGHRDEQALLPERAARELSDFQFTPERVWGRGLSYVFVDGTISGEKIRVRFKKSAKGWQVDAVARREIWYDLNRFKSDYRKECLAKTQEALLAWETWFTSRNPETGEAARLAAQLDSGACKPSAPRPVPAGEGLPPAVDGWNRKLLYFVRDLGPENAPSIDRKHTRLLTIFSRGADAVVGSQDDLAKNILLR
jgi:hypothetical protein